jgi:hypothetical protein
MYTSLRTKFLPWVALLFLAFATNALAEESAFVFHRPNFKDKLLDKPVAEPAGEIELNGGIKVPVFSLAMVSGRQDDKEIFRPQVKRLAIDVKPDVAARLYAYAYPMGIILVPKNWQAWSAAVGADGSAALLFAPDASGQNYLAYSNSGACVGCALSSASLYFDEAKKKAKDDDFVYYSRPANLKMVRLNQFERAYNIAVKSGNPVDGLAYYNAGDDFPFFDVQVSLDKDDHELARAILNQFNASKNRD